MNSYRLQLNNELPENNSRGVQNRKKQIFRSRKPLKVLSLDTRAEPLNAKPFLSSVAQKKVL
jgi:hypothetical protein